MYKKNSCKNCCEPFPCESCEINLPTKCVWFKGKEDLCDGLGEYGDDLETILYNFSDAICALSPSGIPSTIVDSCNSSISVSSSTSDVTTTYTVCLNPEITNTIATHTSQIATLSTCTSNAIVEIISDTLSVSNEGASSPCGRTWRVEYTASGVATYDGIVYNDTTISTTVPLGTGGTQTVKLFNHDYITYNNIANGDSIAFYIDGEITANGSGDTDIVIVELFDATSSTILDSTSLTGMVSSVGVSTYEIEGILEVNDAAGGTGVYKIYARSTHNTANVFTDVTRPKSKSRVDISGIDYTNLTIRVRQNNVSNLSATNNTVGKLKVQVTKKI